MKLTTLVLACLLGACVPVEYTPAPRGEAVQAIEPTKPAQPPVVLPPNVTREVLPDGSIRITIREPRCPNCPWTYSAATGLSGKGG